MTTDLSEIKEFSQLLYKIKERYEDLTYEILQFKSEKDEYNRLKSIFKERIIKKLNKIQSKIMKKSYINYYIKSKEIIKKIENMNLSTSHEEINKILEESKNIIKKLSHTNSFIYLKKYLSLIKRYKKSFRIGRIEEKEKRVRRQRIGFIKNLYNINKPTTISRLMSMHNKEFVFKVNKQLIYEKMFYSYNRNILFKGEFIYKLNNLLIDSQYTDVLFFINSKMKIINLIKNNLSQGFKFEIVGNTKNYNGFINEIINYFQEYLNEECIEYRIEVHRNI